MGIFGRRRQRGGGDEGGEEFGARPELEELKEKARASRKELREERRKEEREKSPEEERKEAEAKAEEKVEDLKRYTSNELAPSLQAPGAPVVSEQAVGAPRAEEAPSRQEEAAPEQQPAEGPAPAEELSRMSEDVRDLGASTGLDDSFREQLERISGEAESLSGSSEPVPAEQMESLREQASFAREASQNLEGIADPAVRSFASEMYARGLEKLAGGNAEEAAAFSFVARRYAEADAGERKEIKSVMESAGNGAITTQGAMDEIGKGMASRLEGAVSKLPVKSEKISASAGRVASAMKGPSVSLSVLEKGNDMLRLSKEMLSALKEAGDDARRTAEIVSAYESAFSSVEQGLPQEYTGMQVTLGGMAALEKDSQMLKRIDDITKRLDMAAGLRRVRGAMEKEGMRFDEAMKAVFGETVPAELQGMGQADIQQKIESIEGSVALFMEIKAMRSGLASAQAKEKKDTNGFWLYEAPLKALDSLLSRLAGGESVAKEDLQAAYALSALTGGNTADMAGLISLNGAVPRSASEAISNLADPRKSEVIGFYIQAQKAAAEGKYDIAALQTLAGSAYASAPGEAGRSRVMGIIFDFEEGKISAEDAIWLAGAEVSRYEAKGITDARAAKNAEAYYDIATALYRKGMKDEAGTALYLASLYAKAAKMDQNEPNVKEAMAYIEGLMGDQSKNPEMKSHGFLDTIREEADARLWKPAESIVEGIFARLLCGGEQVPETAKIGLDAVKFELGLSAAEFSARGKKMALGADSASLYGKEKARLEKLAKEAESAGKTGEAARLYDEAARADFEGMKEKIGEAGRLYDDGMILMEEARLLRIQALSAPTAKEAGGLLEKAREYSERGMALIGLAESAMGALEKSDESIREVKTIHREKGRMELFRAAGEFLSMGKEIGEKGMTGITKERVEQASLDMRAGIIEIEMQKALWAAVKQAVGQAKKLEEENERNNSTYVEIIDTGTESITAPMIMKGPGTAYTIDTATKAEEGELVVQYEKRKADLEKAKKMAWSENLPRSGYYLGKAGRGIALDRMRGETESAYRSLLAGASETEKYNGSLQEFDYHSLMERLSKSESDLDKGLFGSVDRGLKDFDYAFRADFAAQQLFNAETRMQLIIDQSGLMAEKARNFGYPDKEQKEAIAKADAKTIAEGYKVDESGRRAHDDLVRFIHRTGAPEKLADKAGTYATSAQEVKEALESEIGFVRKNGPPDTSSDSSYAQTLSLAAEEVGKFEDYASGYQLAVTSFDHWLMLMDAADDIERSKGHGGMGAWYIGMRSNALPVLQLGVAASENPDKMKRKILLGQSVGLKPLSMQLREDHDQYSQVWLEARGTGKRGYPDEILQEATADFLDAAQNISVGTPMSFDEMVESVKRGEAIQTDHTESEKIGRTYTELTMASMGLVREDGAWTAKDFTREQQEAILIALHGKTEVIPDGTMKVTTMGMDQLIGEFFGVNMKLELGSSTEARKKMYETLGTHSDALASAAQVAIDGGEKKELDIQAGILSAKTQSTQMTYDSFLAEGKTSESYERAAKGGLTLVGGLFLTATGFGSAFGLAMAVMALADLEEQSRKAGGFSQMTTGQQVMGVGGVGLGFAGAGFGGLVGMADDMVAIGSAGGFLTAFAQGGSAARYAGGTLFVLGMGSNVVDIGQSAYSYYKGDITGVELFVTGLSSFQDVGDLVPSMMSRKRFTSLMGGEGIGARSFQGAMFLLAGKSSFDFEAVTPVDFGTKYRMEYGGLGEDAKLEIAKIEAGRGRALSGEEGLIAARYLKVGAKGEEAALLIKSAGPQTAALQDAFEFIRSDEAKAMDEAKIGDKLKEFGLGPEDVPRLRELGQMEPKAAMEKLFGKEMVGAAVEEFASSGRLDEKGGQKARELAEGFSVFSKEGAAGFGKFAEEKAFTKEDVEFLSGIDGLNSPLEQARAIAEYSERETATVKLNGKEYAAGHFDVAGGLVLAASDIIGKNGGFPVRSEMDFGEAARGAGIPEEFAGALKTICQSNEFAKAKRSDDGDVMMETALKASEKEVIDAEAAKYEKAYERFQAEGMAGSEDWKEKFTFKELAFIGRMREKVGQGMTAFESAKLIAKEDISKSGASGPEAAPPTSPPSSLVMAREEAKVPEAAPAEAVEVPDYDRAREILLPGGAVDRGKVAGLARNEALRGMGDVESARKPDPQLSAEFDSLPQPLRDVIAKLSKDPLFMMNSQGADQIFSKFISNSKTGKPKVLEAVEAIDRLIGGPKPQQAEAVALRPTGTLDFSPEAPGQQFRKEPAEGPLAMGEGPKDDGKPFIPKVPMGKGKTEKMPVPGFFDEKRFGDFLKLDDDGAIDITKLMLRAEESNVDEGIILEYAENVNARVKEARKTGDKKMFEDALSDALILAARLSKPPEGTPVPHELIGKVVTELGKVDITPEAVESMSQLLLELHGTEAGRATTSIVLGYDIFERTPILVVASSSPGDVPKHVRDKAEALGIAIAWSEQTDPARELLMNEPIEESFSKLSPEKKTEELFGERAQGILSSYDKGDSRAEAVVEDLDLIYALRKKFPGDWEEVYKGLSGTGPAKESAQMRIYDAYKEYPNLHAEKEDILWSFDQDIIPVAVMPSREACTTCTDFAKEYGVQILERDAAPAQVPAEKPAEVEKAPDTFMPEREPDAGPELSRAGNDTYLTEEEKAPGPAAAEGGKLESRTAELREAYMLMKEGKFKKDEDAARLRLDGDDVEVLTELARLSLRQEDVEEFIVGRAAEQANKAGGQSMSPEVQMRAEELAEAYDLYRAGILSDEDMERLGISQEEAKSFRDLKILGEDELKEAINSWAASDVKARQAPVPEKKVIITDPAALAESLKLNEISGIAEFVRRVAINEPEARAQLEILGPSIREAVLKLAQKEDVAAEAKRGEGRYEMFWTGSQNVADFEGLHTLITQGMPLGAPEVSEVLGGGYSYKKKEEVVEKYLALSQPEKDAILAKLDDWKAKPADKDAAHFLRELELVSGPEGSTFEKFYGLGAGELAGTYMQNMSVYDARKELLSKIGLEFESKKFDPPVADHEFFRVLITGELGSNVSDYYGGTGAKIKKARGTGGALGAYALTVEIAGAGGLKSEKVLFLKRGDLGPDKAGSEYSRLAGVPAPEITTELKTASGVIELKYKKADGTTSGYGFLESMSTLDGKILVDGNGKEIEVKTVAASDLGSIQGGSMDRFFSEPEKRKMLYDELGFALAGSYAVGMWDRHEGNLWLMVMEVKDPDLPISPGAKTTVREYLEKTGYKTWEQDGKLMLLRVGNIDPDAGGNYQAVSQNGSQFSFETGMNTRLGTEDLNRVFSKFTAKSGMGFTRENRDAIAKEAWGVNNDGPLMDGVRRWYKQFGQEKKFRDDVRKSYLSHDGEVGGVGVPLDPMKELKAITDIKAGVPASRTAWSNNGEKFTTVTDTSGRGIFRADYGFTELENIGVEGIMVPSVNYYAIKKAKAKKLGIGISDVPGKVPVASVKGTDVLLIPAERLLPLGEKTIASLESSGEIAPARWDAAEGQQVFRAAGSFTKMTGIQLNEAGAVKVFDYLMGQGEGYFADQFKSVNKKMEEFPLKQNMKVVQE